MSALAMRSEMEATMLWNGDIPHVGGVDASSVFAEMVKLVDDWAEEELVHRSMGKEIAPHSIAVASDLSPPLPAAMGRAEVHL
jgi:hypothetical protein